MVGITQSLAKELARTGITVNALRPGIITTDMWAYNDAAYITGQTINVDGGVFIS